MVAPAQHVRAVAAELARHLPGGSPVVICAKGLERTTSKLLGEVLSETLPDAAQAVLSVPSFAADVARGLHAALILARLQRDIGRQLSAARGYRHLRTYWANDTIGV